MTKPGWGVEWLDKLGQWRWPQLFLLCFIWLGITAGFRPLMLPDEGRYVGVAWEMLASGKLGVPILDGMPYFHKPPLFYWLTAASLNTFGMNFWAARFASILAASIVAVGLFQFVRRYFNGLTATISLVILLTQPFFFAGAQFANLDMLVAAMISLCILSAADAVLRKEAGEAYRTSLLLSYLYAALGLLAKGLIGIMLPGAVLFIWLLATRRGKSLLTLLWVPGIAIFGLIGLPWFLLMQAQYHEFFDYFIIYHHVQRFSEGGFNNRQPFWFYVPALLGMTLPWSPWLWQSLRLPGNSFSSRQRDIQWLMLAWCLVILLFFSIPISKPIGYILPVLPAFAFLIALPFARKMAASKQGVAQRHFTLHLVLAGSICLAVLIGVANHDYATSARQLANNIDKAFSESEPDQLVMVEHYQYDLPFYLHLKRPAWVISDWDDVSIPKHDNWRKELYDARKFHPEAGKETLLNYAQLNERLCIGSIRGSFWILGDANTPSRLSILTGLTAYGSRHEQLVWRLTPELRQTFCRAHKSGSGSVE